MTIIEKCLCMARRAGFAAMLALAGLAVGCQSRAPQPEAVAMEKWQALARESRGYSPVGEQVDAQVLPATDTAAGGPEDQRTQDTDEPALDGSADETPVAVPERALPTLPVTLKMHEVDLKVLLRTLARAANQNMLVSESVKGLATLSISEMPWDRVFKGLLSSHGLTYRWEGDIIRIVGIEDLKRDRELIEENQKILASRKEFDLKLKNLENRGAMAQTLETRVVRVRFADPKTLRENLERFLKAQGGAESAGGGADGRDAAAEGQGAIFVDPHTNSLMIQARRRDLERMLPLIALLDRPTSQVRIEAHIVETSSNTARELGVRWGGLYKHTTIDGDSSYLLPNATDSNYSGYGSNFPIGGLTNFAEGSAGLGLSLGYLFESAGNNMLRIQLSALQEDGKLDILSSPSITTLDNQKAVIESGSEVPYQTVEDGEVKIEFKDAVLKLEVTPHVIDGRTIKLEISTQNNEIDQSNDVGGQPVITKKKAQTTVVLFDGQTTVIGGLSKNKGQRSEAGVPFLKDIPGLGGLFRSKGRSRQDEELLIFITPHILAPVNAVKEAG